MRELRFERIQMTDGVSLNVAIAGHGRPVILLHGFPEDHTSWRHQVEPLIAAGLTVLVPDMRGYGDSDRPRERSAYRIDRLSEDVADLVRSTESHKAHVVGHDWGGVAAWVFAHRFPPLLDRLVILNAPHPAIYREKIRRPAQFLKSWYAMLFQLPWLPEQVLAANDFKLVRTMLRGTAKRGTFADADIDHYVESLRPTGALTAALNYYRANGRPGVFRHLSWPAIEAETLVIWGERDAALSTSLLDGIEHFAPKAQVLRLPHAGHWVQNEVPNEVNDALVPFLTATQVNPS